MKVLFLDVETSGVLLKDKPYGHPDQPALVQLGALLHDSKRVERGSVCLVVNAGREVPAEAEAIHGISTEVVRECGVPERGAVGLLSRLVALAEIVVAHNLHGFDLDILTVSAGRAVVPLDFSGKTLRCTMEASTPIMRLPPTPKMRRAGLGGKFKSPRLSEAYEFFTGRPLEGAHDALVDCRAAAAVYYELEGRGAWERAA